MRLLEAVRMSGVECRYYQASSSEMFGAAPPPQDEYDAVPPALAVRRGQGLRLLDHPELPRGLRLFAVNGILFNHESPRRGETFVTRKITRAIARIKAGLDDHLYMGNLDAVRDWGYAPEYVEGMWRMLQADEPDDYVLATGTSLTRARVPRGGVRPRGPRLGAARPVRRALPAPVRGRRPVR